MFETSASFLPTAVTVNVVLPAADLVSANTAVENNRVKTSSVLRKAGNLNGLIWNSPLLIPLNWMPIGTWRIYQRNKIFCDKWCKNTGLSRNFPQRTVLVGT